MNPVVFQHLPKTGGTTLHNLLKSYFEASKTCPERLNNLAQFSASELSGYSFFSGHFDRDSIKLIDGKPRIITLFREPRDRIQSLYYFWRSHKAEHIQRHGLGGPLIARKHSLIEFLRIKSDGIPGRIENAYARNIIGPSEYSQLRSSQASDEEIAQVAMNYIQGFFCYGLLEYMDLSVGRIFSALELPRPSNIGRDRALNDDDPSREKITKESMTDEISLELQRLCSIDSIIYAEVRSRFLGVCGKTA